MSAKHTRDPRRRVTTLRGQEVREESWPLNLTEGQTTLILKNSACFFKKEMGWITNQCFNNWWVMFNYCIGVLPLKGRTLLPKEDSVTSETSHFTLFRLLFFLYFCLLLFLEEITPEKGSRWTLTLHPVRKFVSALSREDRNMGSYLLKMHWRKCLPALILYITGIPTSKNFVDCIILSLFIDSVRN